VPDPEADIAECHLLAGRREEADRLFAELAERDVDDVWLYNAAGFSYAHAGDHPTAERWLRAGIDTAMRTGDPDGVVGQLHELLHDCLQTLGEPADEALERRIEEFTASWQPAWTPARWPEAAARVKQRCGHCGYDPDLDPGPQGGGEGEEAVGAPAGTVELAVGWFPAGEWPIAIERWPHLLEELPADHAAYSRTVEGRLKRIREASATPRLSVAELDVEGLVAYCAEQGLDAVSGRGGRCMPPRWRGRNRYGCGRRAATIPAGAACRGSPKVLRPRARRS
jgi:tetratricopeptide (TPR) repeat protein